MIDWISRTHAILTADDTPDERILALVPDAVLDAELRIGSNLAGSLQAAEDDRWAAAVTHFLAARLIISSRRLIHGQGFPDSNSAGSQWGQGMERPADLLQLRAMANQFSAKAAQICDSLLANWNEATIRWYDI